VEPRVKQISPEKPIKADKADPPENNQNRPVREQAFQEIYETSVLSAFYWGF
jgi:hypothetical protein